LVALQARGVIESLPGEVEFDESEEYDIVVVGNSDIGIVRM